MYKTVIPILAIFLLSLFSGIASAQALPALPDVQKEVDSTRPKGTATSPADLRRATSKDRVDDSRKRAAEIREELKEKASERQGQTKRRIVEHKKETIRKHLQRIFERLSHSTERMENLADRLEQHINKLAEKGADVSEARAHLEASREHILNTKNDLTALEGIEEELAASENAREYFVSLRDKLSVMKGRLVAAHKLLGSSMGEIKGLSAARKGKNEQE